MKNTEFKEKNPKKTFWPYGILLSLFAIVLACVATIVFASNYPVYEDEYFFEKYQNVKDDFKSIEDAQKKFDENFALSLNLNEAKDKKNRAFYILDENIMQISFTLKQKAQNVDFKDLNATLLLTRPHTSAQNQELEITQAKSDLPDEMLLNAALPALEKGRWQLKLKIAQNADSIGFFTFNMSVQ